MSRVARLLCVWVTTRPATWRLGLSRYFADLVDRHVEPGQPGDGVEAGVVRHDQGVDRVQDVDRHQRELGGRVDDDQVVIVG